MSEQYVDASGVDPSEVDGYVTSQIIIRRILTTDDRDRVYVDWPDDSSLLELMGMLEFAKNIIWNTYVEGTERATDEEEEDNEDEE